MSMPLSHLTGSSPQSAMEELKCIPGVGDSIATDLLNIGIRSIADLKNKNAEVLYERSNQFVGHAQDRCLLYVLRCAVYFASTRKHEDKKLKWWYWKNHTI